MTVLALAGVLSACGGSSDGGDEDPQSVIENATMEGVESGSLDVSLGLVSKGENAGDLTLELSGPFQSRGEETLPELGLDVSASGDLDGDSVDFDGGLTLLSDRAFVRYDGTEYEVDPTTFGFVKSSFEQGLSEGGKEGVAASPTACQEAFTSIDLNSVLDNLENEGSADVDGTETTKVSGDLNPDGALDAIVALTEDPECSSQLEAAGPLPLDELEAARGEVSKALKDARVEVYVGEDNIIRKAVADITIEPQDAPGESVQLNYEITLSGVNEKQTIDAPENAQPLEGLFKELDLDPMALLEASSGGGLGGLLEGLGGEAGGDGQGSGGGEAKGGPQSGASQEYLDCLAESKTPADLQECAQL